MRDALRVGMRMPGFLDAAELWLVEASPALRAVQAAALVDAAPRWAGGVTALPDLPLLVVANEFFDALPVRQFRRTDVFWCERMVAIQGDGLAFVWGSPRSDSGLDARFRLLPDGALVELNQGAEAIVAELAERIATRGGAALIVDYGSWDGTGDTLQAVAGHAPADPLAAPGAADLTAHVRYRALAEAAAALRADGPIGQGLFLERLGMAARANVLAAKLSDEGRETLAAAYRRLTHPDEMGNLFQALALTPNAAPVPAGFAE
jgi:SAM-dependent MidA family methyltransferase